jgi:hypothetical protein
MNTEAIQQTQNMPPRPPHVARQIQSAVELQDMDAADLERMESDHQHEIVTLVGRLECRAPSDPQWARRARQALRVLRLHKHWITAELKLRDKQDAAEQRAEALKAMAEAKLAAAQSHAQCVRDAEAARLARMELANDLSRRHMESFKIVVKEAIGAEMYCRLWADAMKRMAVVEVKS